VIAVACAASARAGNGPETAPVPLPVVTEAPLEKNAFRLDVDATYTSFAHTSEAEARQAALDHGSFESFDHTWLETMTLEYGYREDLTLGASIGYFLGSDLQSVQRAEPASVDYSQADPDGLTDLWLTARWSFDRKDGLSALGGLEIPVGEHQQDGSNGERLDAASQPSADAFGPRFGLAWSTPSEEPLWLAASAVYTLRTDHEDASLGDRIDYGLALTWRSTARLEWLFELSAATLWRDEEHSVEDPNTGGDVLFASAGLRWRIEERVELSIVPQVPVVTSLNGAQADPRARVLTGLSMSF
jgi:hypothetical protein